MYGLLQSSFTVFYLPYRYGCNSADVVPMSYYSGGKMRIELFSMSLEYGIGASASF